MPDLIITSGLPASGKTTYAKAWVGEDPLWRARVNRDDLRDMLFGGYTGIPAHEIAVTKASDASVAALLNKGYSVIMDNTFLAQRAARDAWALAQEHGAEFKVVDFTHVDMVTCMARDAARIARGERGAGDDVIRTMYHKFLRGRTLPLPFPDGPNPEYVEGN